MSEVQERRRGRGSAGAMVRSLFVVIVLVLIVLALTVRSHPKQEVRRFDYRTVLAQTRSAAPYDVLVPTALPRSWRATSARTGTDGDAVTWHLGYVTPQGEFAAVEQSNGAPAPFVEEFVGGGDPAGSVTVGGRSWRRVVNGSPEHRALVLKGADATTVVTGGASWTELRALAASLRG